MHTYRALSRRTAGMAAALAVSSGLLALGAPAASAQIIWPPLDVWVTVPDGCGDHSGTVVFITEIDDHSGGPAIGTLLNPYQATRRITVGSHGDDVIRGLQSGDVICGRRGADIIYGEAGIDELHGGSGEDILHGATGNDTIFGGPHGDFLYGDDPTLSHGVGDSGDEIWGGGGDDVLSGGGHDDVLRGEAGTDEIRGDADLLATGGVGDTAVGGELCSDVELPVVVPPGPVTAC